MRLADHVAELCDGIENLSRAVRRLRFWLRLTLGVYVLAVIALFLESVMR